METNTRVEPIPYWDELSKNFTRMITKDSTKDNKNDIDIVLDHDDFWDNPIHPEPKCCVRAINNKLNSPITYTEEDMNKAFDLGFQWSKTDRAEAPFTFLWRKIKINKNANSH